MGLELGSGGKEEHTQERLVPEPGVCMLVESPGEEQLSPDSRVKKAMIRSVCHTPPPHPIHSWPLKPQLCFY